MVAFLSAETAAIRGAGISPSHGVPENLRTSVDLLFVQFIFVQRLFLQRFSSKPNLIGLDENALDEKVFDENWAHAEHHSSMVPRGLRGRHLVTYYVLFLKAGLRHRPPRDSSTDPGRLRILCAFLPVRLVGEYYS